MAIEWESVGPGVTYGPFKDNNAPRYVFCPTVIRQISDVSGIAITAMLDFIQEVAPKVSSYIPGGETAWQHQQIMGLIAADVHGRAGRNTLSAPFRLLPSRLYCSFRHRHGVCLPGFKQ